MQRYFIHCQWSLDSTCTHVISLGECCLDEAEAKFGALVKGNSEYESITLKDSMDNEIYRLVKPSLKVEDIPHPAPTRLQQFRNLFWSHQVAM